MLVKRPGRLETSEHLCQGGNDSAYVSTLPIVQVLLVASTRYVLEYWVDCNKSRVHECYHGGKHGL